MLYKHAQFEKFVSSVHGGIVCHQLLNKNFFHVCYSGFQSSLCLGKQIQFYNIALQVMFPKFLGFIIVFLFSQWYICSFLQTAVPPDR